MSSQLRFFVLFVPVVRHPRPTSIFFFLPPRLICANINIIYIMYTNNIRLSRRHLSTLRNVFFPCFYIFFPRRSSMLSDLANATTCFFFLLMHSPLKRNKPFFSLLKQSLLASAINHPLQMMVIMMMMKKKKIVIFTDPIFLREYVCFYTNFRKEITFIY